MRIEYDNEVDALQILVRKRQARGFPGRRRRRYDRLGRTGKHGWLEVLDAAEKLGLESILTVTIDTLLAEQSA